VSTAHLLAAHALLDAELQQQQEKEKEKEKEQSEGRRCTTNLGEDKQVRKGQSQPPAEHTQICIHAAHLRAALQETKPSVSGKDFAFFDDIYRRFRSHAAGVSSSKEAAATTTATATDKATNAIGAATPLVHDKDLKLAYH
jgi:hypothetical protein